MERTITPKGKKEPSELSYLLPIWVYDILIKEKNPDGLITLYSFYSRAAYYQKTSRVWSTNRFCINGTKIGRDRFLRAKKRLVELGLIEVIKGERKDGQFGKDYIKVIKYNPVKNTINDTTAKNGLMPQCTENRTPSQNGLMPQCTENPLVGIPYTNTVINTKTNTGSMDVVVSQNEKISLAMFDKFWQLYPKPVYRGKALTEWKRLCQKSDRPTWREIRLAITRQKKTELWSSNHGRFIKHPSNWLSNNGWLDDPKDMIVIHRPDPNMPLYKEFDGIHYNLCSDGYYRDASGNPYID
jgi:predicted transcriptional regulator with HTH domain